MCMPLTTNSRSKTAAYFPYLWKITFRLLLWAIRVSVQLAIGHPLSCLVTALRYFPSLSVSLLVLSRGTISELTATRIALLVIIRYTFCCLSRILSEETYSWLRKTSSISHWNSIFRYTFNPKRTMNNEIKRLLCRTIASLRFYRIVSLHLILIPLYFNAQILQ